MKSDFLTIRMIYITCMRNHLRQSQYICPDIVYFCHIRSKSSNKLKPFTAPITRIFFYFQTEHKSDEAYDEDDKYQIGFIIT